MNTEAIIRLSEAVGPWPAAVCAVAFLAFLAYVLWLLLR